MPVKTNGKMVPSSLPYSSTSHRYRIQGQHSSHRGLKLWLSKLEDLGQIPGTQNLKVRKTSAILTLLLEIENGNRRIAQKPWVI